MTRLVLVEDDPWYAAQQQRVLARAGYAVTVAPDAETAMDQLLHHQPAGLIVDLLLRYNTALPLLHELQTHSVTAELPVIVYTTHASAAPLAALSAYGVRRVLDKTTMQPHDTVTALKKAGVEA